MEVVYSGFDALDCAFQGRLSQKMLDRLSDWKEAAAERGQAIPVKIGALDCYMFPTAPQGTRYHLDFGPLGEKWFIAAGQDPQQWNIRCSTAQEALATLGYEAVKDNIWGRLKALKAQVLDHRISRVDFAIDLDAPDFKLRPERLIAHYNSRKVFFCDAERGESKDFQIYYYNHEPASMRVGRVSHRQVAIYDKTREIRHAKKEKAWWYEIWGRSPENRPKIWRIELRAGRDYLKEFHVDRFDDLDAAIADVLLCTMEQVRLVAEGQSDTNVTRQEWDPVWKKTYRHIEMDLHFRRAGVCRSKLRARKKSEVKNTMETLTVGISATLAHVLGEGDMDKIPKVIASCIETFIRRNPAIYQKKMNAVADRYLFLDEGLDE